MAKALDLIAGDHVSWHEGQDRLTGEVLRKSICRLSLSDHEYEASLDDPRFIVRADETGELFAPRAAALQRIKTVH